GDYEAIGSYPHVAWQLGRLGLNRLGLGQGAHLDSEGVSLPRLDPGEPGVVSGRADAGVDDRLPERLQRIGNADAAPQLAVQFAERHESTPALPQESIRAA